jgi:MFS family permease
VDSDPQPKTPLPESRHHYLPEAIRRGFQALEIRNYRLFWTGQLLSLTGSWMQSTAQAWLVLQLSNSPLALGLVTTVQFLPITLFTLFAGVITDRFPKHRLLLITQTAALLQAIVFGTLVATGWVQLWHVYVLAALHGFINAVDNPTRQAIVPELTGIERLRNAVALNSLVFNGARIFGAALGGLVIAQFGVAAALYLNAVSFVGVITNLLRMDAKAFYLAPKPTSGPILLRLLEGLKYVWQTPVVLAIMLVIGAVGTFGYNFSVVLPLLAGFVLHTDAAGLGSLSAFLGLGALFAALATAYAKRITLRRLLLGAGMFSLLLGGVALSNLFATSAVLLVALGFAGVITTTSANTLLQLTVPDALRGRVMSLYILLFVGSTPLGGFIIGTLSSVIGASTALLICATICALGVVMAAVYLWWTA